MVSVGPHGVWRSAQHVVDLINAWIGLFAESLVLNPEHVDKGGG